MNIKIFINFFVFTKKKRKKKKKLKVKGIGFHKGCICMGSYSLRMLVDM